MHMEYGCVHDCYTKINLFMSFVCLLGTAYLRTEFTKFDETIIFR